MGYYGGIIGDRYGRIKVLFGSILLYSVANYCQCIRTRHTYIRLIRFYRRYWFAGKWVQGLHLVNESMDKGKRGYGTMLIATIGVLGAVAAFYIAEHFEWRMLISLAVSWACCC